MMWIKLPILCSCFLFAVALNAAEPRSADTIFNNYCFACHGTGWENAPVIGDVLAWDERKEKGMDTLMTNTKEGLNGMPAKGACVDCTDEELRAVIEMLIE